MSRNIIQTQIQSLRTHPHIKKLQKINNRLLHMIYYPKDIKSYYAKSEYRLKIELPIKYPEEPPIVKFTDPISHINISEKNGEVTMPILVEDWSPYISLYIIIDLIDTILVEPELSPQYCIGNDRLKNTREKPHAKREEIFDANFTNEKKIQEIPLFNTAQYGEISVIKKASATEKKDELLEDDLKPIGTMKKKLKRLKTIILEKSHQFVEKHPTLSPNNKLADQIDKISQQESLILNEKQESEVNPGKKFPKKDRRMEEPQSFRDIPEVQSFKLNLKKNDNSSRKNGQKQQMDMQGAFKTFSKPSKDRSQLATARKSRQQQQMGVNKRYSEQGMDQSMRGLNTTAYLQNTTNNLTKINRILQIFTNELYELEKKKSQTKNDHFAKIIERKLQQQISMIEQLQELSSAVKKSMISNLKKQINR